MSPIGKSRGNKTGGAGVPDNLYTVILALAFCVVVATAAFVAYQCHVQYNTFFTIP
jgi:hypothetical protein